MRADLCSSYHSSMCTIRQPCLAVSVGFGVFVVVVVVVFLSHWLGGRLVGGASSFDWAISAEIETEVHFSLSGVPHTREERREPPKEGGQRGMDAVAGTSGQKGRGQAVSYPASQTRHSRNSKWPPTPDNKLAIHSERTPARHKTLLATPLPC